MEKRLSTVSDADIQHRALLHGIIALRNFPQQLDLPRFQLRDEPHRADIDAQNREIMLRCDLGRVQNCPVAAEADQHIRRLDLFLNILKAKIMRNFKRLIHVKRQAERDLCARFP